MPLEIFTESIVTGYWPRLDVPDLPLRFDAELSAARALVAGFLRARGGQLSALPKDAASRGRAFPTPRTWDYTARLVALARALTLRPGVQRLLVNGTIGASTGHEFLAWVSALDLPDPEELLADPQPRHFKGLRPDRVHIALQSVLAALVGQLSPQRWTAAMVVCAVAATEVGVDPAVPVVRALLRGEMRPPGAELPAGMAVFAAPLALAGLLPS